MLTIDEKLEIVSLLNNNHSLAAIASKYGIIKRDRQKLLDFKKQTLDMGMYVFISIKYNFQLSERFQLSEQFLKSKST